jgi:hypothetical protein
LYYRYISVGAANHKQAARDETQRFSMCACTSGQRRERARPLQHTKAAMVVFIRGTTKQHVPTAITSGSVHLEECWFGFHGSHIRPDSVRHVGAARGTLEGSRGAEPDEFAARFGHDGSTAWYMVRQPLEGFRRGRASVELGGFVWLWLWLHVLAPHTHRVMLNEVGPCSRREGLQVWCRLPQRHRLECTGCRS